MIWLFIFGPLSLLMILLLAGRIGFKVLLNNRETDFYFKYWFYSKKITKGEEKEERKKEEKEEKSRKGAFLKILKLIPDLTTALRKFLTLFVKHAEIPVLKLEGEYGTGDPFSTGASYGLVGSTVGIIESYVPQFEFELIPNFTEEIYRIKGEGEGRIRLGALLLVLLVTLFYLPKRKVWALIRNR